MILKRAMWPANFYFRLAARLVISVTSVQIKRVTHIDQIVGFLSVHSGFYFSTYTPAFGMLPIPVSLFFLFKFLGFLSLFLQLLLGVCILLLVPLCCCLRLYSVDLRCFVFDLFISKPIFTDSSKIYLLTNFEICGLNKLELHPILQNFSKSEEANVFLKDRQKADAWCID